MAFNTITLTLLTNKYARYLLTENQYFKEVLKYLPVTCNLHPSNITDVYTFLTVKKNWYVLNSIIVKN
jgi:hypothetical protein